MSRFKVGQTVYMGRGEKERQLVVAKVINNPLLPIRQYSFEEPNSGWACGEQSIRSKSNGRDLTISECIINSNTKEAPSRVNTIASALRTTIDSDEFGVKNIFKDCDLRFKPCLLFTKWIADYANGRLCIDVGSGQGHLVRMLKMTQAKAIGIEPNFYNELWLKYRLMRNLIEDIDINEIISRPIEDCKGLIDGINDKGMLIFARPKTKDFVYQAIKNMPSGMEALFITTIEDLESFNYLGEFKNIAKVLKHKGQSEDNEIVFSIIRP